MVLAKSQIAPVNQINFYSHHGFEWGSSFQAFQESDWSRMQVQIPDVSSCFYSETIFCMIDKLRTQFCMYEGVRIGEIQASQMEM